MDYMRHTADMTTQYARETKLTLRVNEAYPDQLSILKRGEVQRVRDNLRDLDFCA